MLGRLASFARVKGQRMAAAANRGAFATSFKSYSSTASLQSAFGGEQFSDANTPIPLALTKDVAVQVYDMAKTYLSYGAAGQHLSQLAQDSSRPLAERWAHANEVYCESFAKNGPDRTLLQIAIPLGYKEDATGMQRYLQDVSQLMQTDNDVAERNADVIRLMVFRGFGVELDSSNGISVTQAREYAMKLSQSYQEEEFLARIESEVGTMPAGTEQEQALKSAALQNILQPRNMEVLEACGFHGDEGFLKMQVAMLAHARDYQTMSNLSTALTIAGQRAGIGPPGSL